MSTTESFDSIVRALADRAAITDVLHRYCWALDTRTWELLDDVFTIDARAFLIEDLTGRDAIKRRIERALEGMDRTQHLVANIQIDLDGDKASCRSYVQAQHVREAAHGGPNYLIGGRYEDRMVRTLSGWRIDFRSLQPLWSDGNPNVARP